MRWPVFSIVAFLVIVLELSLRNVFRLEKLGGVSPSFTACLAVFVALFAHRLSVIWACWILGLLLDLAPTEGAAWQIIGPNTLGYVFGGLLILQLRTMVFRRRSITLGALTLAFVLSASVATVAVLTMRGWLYPAEVLKDGAVREMTRRLAVAVYSGVIGIPIGWVLLASLPTWGFQSNIPGRTRPW